MAIIVLDDIIWVGIEEQFQREGNSMTMKQIFKIVLKSYDVTIVNLINEKYEISYMKAFIEFVNSKTYKMLENIDLKMYEFSPLAIFDMWENEKITGTPQTSVYLESVD